MRWLVAVALAVLLSGCICTPSSKDATTEPTTTIRTTATKPTTPAAPVAALTALGGLETAKQRILALRPDAILVGVSGATDQAGESAQWEYQYDSLQGKKGYALDASGEVRERPYSFRADLGGSWTDSDRVAALCKAESGEFSLEVQDGKPVWTVITDGNTCLVDAATGTVIGGDE